LEKENYLHFLMVIEKQKPRMMVKLKDFGMGKVMKTHLNFH